MFRSSFSHFDPKAA